jgi:hypothetical protein
MLIKDFTSGKEFFEQFILNKDYIIVTIVTEEFCDMAINWFLSLKAINENNNALVIALDEYSYQQLLKFKVNVVYIEAKIKQNQSFEDWVENEKIFKVSCYYFLAIKYPSLDLIMCDSDIFFMKSFIKKLKNEIIGYDWVVMSDRRFDPFVKNREKNVLKKVSEDKKSIINFGEIEQTRIGIQNGSFSFLNIRNFRVKRNLSYCFRFLCGGSAYLNKFPKGKEDGCLQTIGYNRSKEVNLRVKYLNAFEFVNGSIWKIPYLKNKIKDKCYLIHYNYVDECPPQQLYMEKMKWMKENNHWLL